MKSDTEKLIEARSIALDLLRMNYTQMQPWVITRACVYFDHQPRRTSQMLCICGQVKYGARETA